MGTHNCLSRLGRDTFLELITVNPRGMNPIRPRWFNLDNLPPNTPLTTHAIILRSNHIIEDLNKARDLGIDLGEPVSLCRDGLRWKFAVRQDGTIPLVGTAPMIMQWEKPVPHPALKMTDQHIRLIAITLSSPHAALLTDLYKALGWTDLTIIEGAPKLSVTLEINQKLVTL